MDSQSRPSAPSEPPTARRTLPVSVAACGMSVTQRDGMWYTHHSMGRVLNELATRVQHLHYFSHFSPDPEVCDCPLSAPNITVGTWFERRNTIQAMKHPLQLLRDYRQVVAAGDVLFLRGGFPLLWTTLLSARRQRRGVVQWIVGNPAAILRGAQRGYGIWTQRLGLCFALFEQAMTRFAMRWSGAYTLTNGDELGRIFASPRTTSIVSTSISRSDMRHQEDTCTGPEVRLTYVGFIRAEKGIEYLIRALPLMRASKPVKLTLVGSWAQFPTEYERLRALIQELGLTDCVHWYGNARHGPELFGQIDAADIVVLPSLSEGTPRVLVEARARSVPVVSTRVGGIPTSVTDGVDGLLVPPRDPTALAEAISRLINDHELRRNMIRTGRERVANLTIETFIDLVVDRLQRAFHDNGGVCQMRPAGTPEEH